MRDVHHKLRRLSGSRFISLEQGGQLIGAYVLRGKKVRIGGTEYPAYYRTFLAVDPSKSGQGYGTVLVQETRRHYSRKLGKAGVLYGYIEADNESSLRVSQHAGYVPVGSFSTTLFNRLRPRDDPRVRSLAVGERGRLVALLNEQYAEHALRDFEQSVDAASYYVLAEDHAISAGMQIEPCHWQVLRLPGVSGRLLIQIVSRVPGLRRLFDARNCRFLKLGNLYVCPGKESEVFTLAEALLARVGVTLAMAFQDTRSPVYQRIARCGSFGILNSGVDARVYVMAALEGFTSAQRAECLQMPLCISPMDIG